MNEKKSNVLSILSLIFGIIGLLLSCLTVGIVLCIPALILGIVALTKKQSKGMSIAGIVCSAIGILIAGVVLIAGLSGSDSKTESTAAPVSTLIGNWEVEDKGDTYQAGYITADTIEIFWMSDGDASLYWSGSFDNPAELTDGYSWDSVNNKDKTDVALLASGDDTKTFTYSGGKITYEASAFGTTKTMTLIPCDTDYSVYASDSDLIFDFGSDEESADETVSVADVSIDECVLYEGNDVIITVKGIEQSGSDYEVKLLIENNSALNLGFNAHAYGVNGIMTRNNIYDMDCDVAAGKKTNTSFKIESSFLNEYDISEIRFIDILFWAYDNDKMFKEFDTDQLRIYTSLYDNSDDIPSGDTIYSDDNIRVDFVSSEGNDYTFLIVNNTITYMDFDFAEISINDYTVSDIDYDLYDESLLSSNAIFCTIKVSDEFMQENDIETVEKIEWNLNCRPESDYFNEYKAGTILYTVQ